MSKLRIVSDGTAAGTHVYQGDFEIKGITSITFQPLLPGENFICSLTFVEPEIDLEAEQVNG